MIAQQVENKRQSTVQDSDVHSLDYAAAVRHVTQIDPAFEVTEVEVRGLRYPVFANVPDNVPQMLLQARAAHLDGANTIFVYENDRQTYDEMTADVSALANALSTRFGVKSGDRVAIVSRNYPEMLTAIFAVASLGGVSVILNAWWTTSELKFGLSDSDVTVVFADGPRIEQLTPLVQPMGLSLIGLRDGENRDCHSYSSLCKEFQGKPAPKTQIDPDADFAIMYSSGTSGAPKGVVQTHRGVVNAVRSWMMQARIRPFMLRPGDPLPPVARLSYLIATPLFHVTALYPMAMLGIASGAQITLMRKWDANEALRIIQAESVTRFVGVPTQTADLTEVVQHSNAPVPTLTYLGSGGAKRPPAHVLGLAKAFPGSNIGTGWGMTETCALGIGMQGDEYIARPNAAGRPYPPIQQIRIIGDDDLECPTGEIGELHVRSVATMRCYLNRPEDTAKALLPDGWLATGDLGFVDAEGFVTICDRKKNIIIRGGENISCAEVENALHEHPDIIEACVFPIPHERLGETVGAALHLRDGACLNLETVSLFLETRLSPFKIPQQIWIQSIAFPRGTTDKTDVKSIRKRCLGV